MSRDTSETVAVEGYRTGALSETQIRWLLGLETRFLRSIRYSRSIGVPFSTRRTIWKKTLPLSGSLGILLDR